MTTKTIKFSTDHNLLGDDRDGMYVRQPPQTRTDCLGFADTDYLILTATRLYAAGAGLSRRAPAAWVIGGQAAVSARLTWPWGRVWAGGRLTSWANGREKS